jgi:site-specific DNA-cytosine methylase
VEVTTAFTGGLGSGGPDAAHAQAGWLVPQTFVKAHRAASPEDGENWDEGELAPTVNAFDVGDARATALVGTLRVGGRDNAHRAGDSYDNTPWGHYPAGVGDDELLPLGLDSNRYRCCGNGVVSGVSEWIGQRLAEALR